MSELPVTGLEQEVTKPKKRKECETCKFEINDCVLCSYIKKSEHDIFIEQSGNVRMIHKKDKRTRNPNRGKDAMGGRYR